MPYYDPNREFSAKLFDFLIVLTACATSGVLLITSLFFLLFPNTPILISSSIPSTWFAPFRLTMAYIFPHYLCISMCAVFGAMLGVLAIYGVLVVPFLMKEIRLDRTNYKSRKLLRQPLHLTHFYRSAQILQIRLLTMVQFMIIPTQTLISYLILFSSVMLIKFGNIMSLVSKGMLVSWILASLIFWASSLAIGGHMYWFGKKILVSWKCYSWSNRRDKVYMSKFRKSCKPLMLNFGRTYVIRPLSVLKFLRGISRGIFKALLTINKHS